MKDLKSRDSSIGNYYDKSLAAEKLKKCYDIAPPRIQQYLNAEILHVLKKTGRSEVVLELGCGYGRVIFSVAGQVRNIVGIDTSLSSLILARKILSGFPNVSLIEMNAAQLAFRNKTFDRVICIQNGISAFGKDPRILFRESMRITRPAGSILFSSYSEKFWEYRLKWFELQAEAGLLGKIDYSQTGRGIIQCRDGFRATTFTSEQFLSISSELGVNACIEEVDQSSLFCEIILPG